MTGIQALERAAPTKPAKPGQIEKREFEYIRHGTRSLIANLEVATGRILYATLAQTGQFQERARVRRAHPGLH